MARAGCRRHNATSSSPATSSRPSFAAQCTTPCAGPTWPIRSRPAHGRATGSSRCRPAGSGHRVLEYLGRYVFRIAITNRRLESFANGRVTFRYRDRRPGQQTRRTLPAPTFLARFLQHVLPRGFGKVRHYGLASPTCRRQLDAARSALPPASTPATASITPDNPGATADPARGVIPDTDRCPGCHVGRLVVVAILPRARPP